MSQRGGRTGQRLRELAQSGRENFPVEDEINLFLRDRDAHQRELVLPSLAAGRDVILDRYYFSSMAYQGARGGNVVEIERRNREVAREPDLLVVTLELPADEALARITEKRGAAPDLFEGREYLHAVEAIFRAMDYPYLMHLDARRPTASWWRRLGGWVRPQDT